MPTLVQIKKSKRNIYRELRWGLHFGGSTKATASYRTWREAMQHVARLHKRWPGIYRGSGV